MTNDIVRLIRSKKAMDTPGKMWVSSLLSELMAILKIRHTNSRNPRMMMREKERNRFFKSLSQPFLGLALTRQIIFRES